jgi:hypothetical protein
MTIARLSKSGGQVQIVDDLGNVYVTSKSYMLSFLMGNLKSNMLMFQRLPLMANPERYPKSPLYDPDGLLKRQDEFKNNSNANDIFGVKAKEKLQKEKEKVQEDFNPW